MSTVATRSYTVEEYLDLDAEAEDERYEFQNGSVIPMIGADLLAMYIRMSSSLVIQLTKRPDREPFRIRS